MSLSELNPLTPMSDQDRISPYNNNTLSSWQWQEKRGISIRGLFVDSISYSIN